MENRWYDINVRAAGGVGDIYIYDEIGAFGITAKSLIDELKDLQVKRLIVHINSPGGEVFDGIAIYNALRNHKTPVQVSIDGAAFSIASVVAMSGDTVSMAENPFMMIHDPWSLAIGTADDLRHQADVLDKTRSALVRAYVDKTGKDAEEIRAMMAAETWMDAEDALEHHFIDEITGEVKQAASFDLSKFHNVPSEVKSMPPKPQPTPTPAPKDPACASPHADRDVLAREQQRRADVRSVFRFHVAQHRDLLDQCLDDVACSPKQASHLLLTELGKGLTSLAQPPVFAGGNPYGGVDPEEFKAAAIDALCLRENIALREPHKNAPDLRRYSIVDIAERCLQNAGLRTAGMSRNKIISAAFTHTTSDFPSLLSGVAGKALMQGFEDEPASHAAWVKVADIPDFKVQTRVQRSEAPDLLLVLESGEYKHGTFAEKAETYQLSTYGRIFTISRQAIINDDLDAFTTLPQAFGASGRRLEADKVYEIFTTNPNMSDGTALFHADHNNLAAAGTALGADGLGIGRHAMRVQKGQAGTALLNIIPRYLIVPAALETDAEVLIASTAKPDQANPNVPNAEFIQSLILVVEPRLDEDSETAWYLAASAQQIDTVEVGYLEGQRGIDFEEKEGWEVDGLAVKARLDFGTKAIEWKGLYKNPGA